MTVQVRLDLPIQQGLINTTQGTDMYGHYRGGYSSSITRQHFRRAAYHVRTSTDDAFERLHLAESFATFFSGENPNFSRSNFISECGLLQRTMLGGGSVTELENATNTQTRDMGWAL